jgi:dephospho-CoA kinase
MDDMDVDNAPTAGMERDNDKKRFKLKRFEVKKVSDRRRIKISDVVVDNFAVCQNHTSVRRQSHFVDVFERHRLSSQSSDF